MFRGKILVAVVVALLVSVVAHGQETVADPTSDHIGFAKEYLEAWSSGDIDRILKYYADDVVYEDVPNVDIGWEVSWRGKERLREALVEMFTGMPDLGFEFGSVRKTGDGMVVEWTMTGTHTGDYPSIPATGRSISVRGISVMEVREGKIAWNRDYYDMFLFLSQLGVVPAMGRE